MVSIQTANITNLPNGDTFVTAPSGQIYYSSGDVQNCTLSYCPVELSVYGYRPSLPASSTLIALYALCMIIQSYQGWHYKSWGYVILSSCFGSPTTFAYPFPQIRNLSAADE
jgi:hypothetical protein